MGRGLLGAGCMIDGRHGAAGVALLHQTAGHAFAIAALGGDAQLELNVVKIHAGVGVACNLTVRHSAADTHDHGLAFWLAGG